METARNPWWKSLLTGVLWVLAYGVVSTALGMYVARLLHEPGLMSILGMFAGFAVWVGILALGAWHANRRGHKRVMTLLLVMAILAEWLAVYFFIMMWKMRY